jgi:hypothetical protein
MQGANDERPGDEAGAFRESSDEHCGDRANFSQRAASGKPDQFADVFADACQRAGRLRASGWDEDAIADALQHDNLAQGMPLTPRRIARIARWIGRKPPGVSARSRTPDPTVQSWLAHARCNAETLLHYGVYGRTCHLVFLALLSIMEKTGSLTVFASCRDLAEVTGVSRATIADALNTLSGTPGCRQPRSRTQSAGARTIPVLLSAYRPRRTLSSRHTRLFLPANSYTLRHGATERHTQNTLWGGAECPSVAPCLPAAFRGKRGLPRTRWLALHVIATQRVSSAAQVRALTGMALRTAKVSLQDLVHERLIEKRDGIWCRTAETLDAVAERRGSQGTADRQKAEHAWQRESVIDRQIKRGGVLRLRSKPAPSPVWEGTDTTAERPLKMAASFKPVRTRKKKRGDAWQKATS